MPFLPPTFNATCNITTAGDGAPRLANVPCNLAFGKRVALPAIGGIANAAAFPCTMQLLLPAKTDIRSVDFQGGADTVTINGRPGMLYTVLFADTIGFGFPNEHRVAILIQQGPLPIPFNY